ncbi:MAG: hypothetical protein D6735_13740 [Acidobacteria bacterium]|nr:MAG: hypothetical protein D6735_13740 [Acidobacteriota bacterium]
MKIKYSDILNTINKADEIKRLQLPIRQSLAVVGALRKCQAAWQDFDTVRQGILDKYGFRNLQDVPEEEREQQRKHNESVLPQVNAELNEALDTEVEIDFQPIELARDIEVSVELALAIHWMFKGD